MQVLFYNITLAIMKDTTLAQLKSLVEEALKNWTHKEFCFYKAQLEAYVLQKNKMLLWKKC